MKTSEIAKPPQTSLSHDIFALLRNGIDAVRTRVGGRRALILLGVAAAGAGIALNWSWLVAIGVAPVLVALAPCAAMCALGMCMSRMGGKSCSTNQGADNGSNQIAGPRSEPPSTAQKVEPDPT